MYLLPKESQMNDFSDNDRYNFGRKKTFIQKVYRTLAHVL